MNSISKFATLLILSSCFLTACPGDEDSDGTIEVDTCAHMDECEWEYFDEMFGDVASCKSAMRDELARQKTKLEDAGAAHCWDLYEQQNECTVELPCSEINKEIEETACNEINEELFECLHAVDPELDFS